MITEITLELRFRVELLKLLPLLVFDSFFATGQQLEKAAQGTGAEDSADVRGPHATLAVKLQVMAMYVPDRNNHDAKLARKYFP